MKRYHRSALTAMRRGLWFGVGSILITRDKISAFVQEAMARGQEVEQEGKALVQERRGQPKRERHRRIDVLDVQIDNALKRLGVPSHQDLDALEQQIARLTESIDRLGTGR